MASVLLIESEVIFGSFLEEVLKRAGYSVDFTLTVGRGWEKLLSKKYDIVITEVYPADKECFDLCKKIRKRFGSDILLIIINTLNAIPELLCELNGKSEKNHMENFSDLSARILRIIRDHEETEGTGLISCGDIWVDSAEKKNFQDGHPVNLTKKEYKLLSFFIMNKGKIVSRMSLLKNVWGKNFDTNTNIVDVYVNHLREKIEKGSGKKLIHTVVGIGYIMAEEGDGVL
ncbi:MAG: response regulator transcription factor [Rikenellaceae bacterium]|nr:response regulator transcription factor [Rikenellaceae bacterium]